MAANPHDGPPLITPAEEELLLLRHRLMDLAGIGIYRYDLEGTVLHMDAMTLRVLDLEEVYPDPAMVVGMKLGELFQYLERPALVRETVLREGRAQGLEYHFRTRAGRLKWCIHDAFLVRDEAADREAVQVISRDITEIKIAQLRLEEANRELSSANAQLRTLDELKTNLLANVSHELRSPLVTVRGYAELIRSGDSGPVNPIQKRQLDLVLLNVDRLAALIDDLIQSARTPADTTNLLLGSGELHGLLEAAIANLEPRRRSRKVYVETRFHPAPIPLVADLRLLTQVAVNLIDNAIKFTPEGGRVIVSTTMPDPDHLILTVSDTGIGIPAEALPHVFERFYQVDSSSTRSFVGLGLGLAICQDAVQRHGGSINVESSPGKGSTFQVRLPRSRGCAESG